MNYKSMLLGLMATVAVFQSQPSQACTGITLTAKDSTRILARTIEWGGSDLNSCYVVVPRGYTAQSYVPGGQDGMKFTAKYGYVGLSVEQKEFVAEGLNEKGLLPVCSISQTMDSMRPIRLNGSPLLLPICSWYPGSWGIARPWTK